MPLLEYKCSLGHVTERLFLSSGEAEKSVNQLTRCKHISGLGRYKGRCGFIAHRVTVSQTGAPILKSGGAGGFYKPSKADSLEE